MGQTAFQRLARKLKINKPDWELLKQALTHKSYLGEMGWLSSNERLEFLGDSVIGLIVAEYLYATFGDKPEGELAKAKAVVVSEPILAETAKKIGIPDALLLSTSEDSSGGRGRSSILADAFEAVVAALYLTHGLEAAREFVLKGLGPIIEDIESEEHHRNYKSLLQELTQSLYKQAPQYSVVDASGADHDKTFTVQVHLDGSLLGAGEGKSKKQAEQAAAFEALQNPLFEVERWRKSEP